MEFLLWNLNRQPLQGLVARLVQERRVDVLILLECSISVGTLLGELHEKTGRIFHYCSSPAKQKKIQVFTSFPARFMTPVAESHRYSIRKLNPPSGHSSILLAMVHFPSKLHWNAESQAQECSIVARMVEEEERTAGHTRTVLVGDLNMNPFEPGMIGTAGFHATASRRRALREWRTVQQRRYQYFHNPMWRLFGDGENSPPGTYHYESREHVAYFWNMFDQVLLRPSLLPVFRSEHLAIVSSVEGTSLLNGAGEPDHHVGSDHLPVAFSINI